MIVRLVTLAGLFLVVGAWLLVVPFSPPPFQRSSGSSIVQYRDAGLMPKREAMTLSEAVGHEVFEIPPADAERLAQILADGDDAAAMEGMHGMEMAKPESGGTGQPAPSTEMVEGGHAPQTMADMPMAKEGDPHAGIEDTHGMETAERAQTPQPMQDMMAPAKDEAPAEEHGASTVHAAAEPGHAEKPGGMTDMPMATGHGAGPGGHAGGDGLVILSGGMAKMARRTVEIEIREWSFSPAKVTVTPGEPVHFVLRNAGNIPHEFMFMSGTAMSAVDYRLERADWNLLEHAALFERPIVLPGDSFEVVLRVERPGTWMYMCMFPFHMQFGMMGMMTTEESSMDGGAMGGMKM